MRTYRGGHKGSDVQTCNLEKGCLSVGPRDGWRWDPWGCWGQLRAFHHADMTSLLSCWDPQSHLAWWWCPCGHWPQPLLPSKQGVGAPIHQFLEIPLVLASCSMSLVVKIPPYSANKKRGCLFPCSFPHCQNWQPSGPEGLEMWGLGCGDPVSAN